MHHLVWADGKKLLYCLSQKSKSRSGLSRLIGLPRTPSKRPKNSYTSGSPLLGGLAVPLRRLRIVLGHAFALGIHDAEVELGPGIPLLGKRPEFTQGGGVVLNHAFALVIHGAEEEGRRLRMPGGMERGN